MRLAVVAGGPGTGKTARAVQWLLEEPKGRRLVVASHPQRLAAMNLVHSLRPGLADPAFWAARVMIPSEVEFFTRGHGPLEFWVDDAEIVLAEMLRLRVPRYGQELPPSPVSTLAGMSVTGEAPGPAREQPTIAHFIPNGAR